MKLSISIVLLLCAAYTFANDFSCSSPGFKLDARNARMNEVMPLKMAQMEAYKAAGKLPANNKAEGAVPCDETTGFAGEYACKNVDQLSVVPLPELGSNGEGNDIWGWTDPETAREYAIMCCTDGTSFVDVTEPESPQVLGFLPTQTTSTVWRDAKVYKNYAFIVSEALKHGMQIFDLTKLRDLEATSPVTILEPDTVYEEFGSSHNIVINEESGFAYSVGTRTCEGGLHVVDISDPLNPTCAGCYWQDGYTHDAQCVNYNGPDSKYVGSEICFCYNEDTLTIVDVSDKTNMIQLARISYNNATYTHQGWLSMDSKYLFLNDELDEVEGKSGGGDNGQKTRSLIWNVESLEDPFYVGPFYSEVTAIDHNLYVNGTHVFESNYSAGLRILRFSQLFASLREVAYFDVSPGEATAEFFGTWSNYPYFSSGNVIVSSIERGLFVLKPYFRF